MSQSSFVDELNLQLKELSEQELLQILLFIGFTPSGFTPGNYAFLINQLRYCKAVYKTMPDSLKVLADKVHVSGSNM